MQKVCVRLIAYRVLVGALVSLYVLMYVSRAVMFARTCIQLAACFRLSKLRSLSLSPGLVQFMVVNLG